MAESKKELKSILIKVKEESENTGLNHSIQKMDHGIRSHQFMPVDGETMGTVADFIVLGTKITADGDCSHKIKRRLLLGRKKNFDQPRQHNKKPRHYFAKKCPYGQTYGFSSSHVWI